MASLLQRLKERKLVQWALAYSAGAWVVVEASSLVVAQFHWPEVVGQVITVVAFIGFFVTLILAWYHGEKGRQRVSGPELLMIAALVGIAGIVLTFVGGTETETDVAGSDNAPASVERNRPAIAVLPFDNLSPDPDNAYFAAGMHEQIISQLAKNSGLIVISRNSVLGYAADRKTTTEVAVELGVDFILEGSARRDRDQVRVTAQLIDGRTDEHLWAEDYDRDLTVGNLFEIQDDVADRVSRSLSARILPEGAVSIGKPATNALEAYDAYVLGRHHLNTRSPEGLHRAVEYLEAAVAIDPGFAEAYSGLADAYALLPMYSDAPVVASFSMAKNAAATALALDSTLAEAHASLGYIAMRFDRDTVEAEARFRRAIQLGPNYVNAHLWFAVYLTQREMEEEAVAEFNESLALDPRSFATLNVVGSAYYVLRRYPEALTLMANARELNPAHEDPRRTTSLSLYAMGRFDEARTQLADLIGEGEWIEHLPADIPAARAGWNTYVAAQQDVTLSDAWRIWVGGLVEDRETVLGLLETLRTDRAPWLSWVVQYPVLDFLHSDLRFMEIVDEVGVVLDRRLAR